jgi:acyl-coenzyme A synthetase/AMP-(fatty) acid ligase
MPGKRKKGDQLVALVVTEKDQKSLRAQLAKRLEPMARPKTIRIVKELPLTSMGKIDFQKAKQIASQPPRRNSYRHH